MNFRTALPFFRLFALAAIPLSVLMLGGSFETAHAQACVQSSNNQTCTNSVALSGADGIFDTGTLTLLNTAIGTITGTPGAGVLADIANVTNFGTISGNNVGVAATTANVTNYGTIQGTSVVGRGILGRDISVTNFGTIFGPAYGIRTNTIGLNSTDTIKLTNFGTILTTESYSSGVVGGIVTVTNSGLIQSMGYGGYGISGQVVTVTNSGTILATNAYGLGVQGKIVTVTNSGTISASVAIVADVVANVTNSGTLIGSDGIALQFAAGADTLTVLPGARFGGLVNFGGGADTVNFGPGSWIINTANFNAALSQINTSGNPYWVTPNQIIVTDMSSFGAVNRAMLDITNWIGSVLPDTPVFEPAGNSVPNAFAAIQSIAPRIEEAFANFPGGAMSSSTMSYAPTSPVFKGGAVQDAYGNAFWAKGFGGRREQDNVGTVLGSITTGYGGAIGYDHRVNPAFQVGVLAGMSNNKTSMNLNAGSTDIDTAFGGGYIRTFFGASFLDLAFIGGQLDNTSKRNIGGGLDLQTATANYNGWFINPMATLGHRIAFGNGVTLTPAIKVRYLKSQFDNYVETGSSANMAVNGWESSAFEERAELSLASVQYFGGDSRILFRMAGGALAQQRQGDSGVGLTFAGQSLLALTPDQRRVNGWYGNAGFDWQSGRVAIFAAGEITDTSDAAVTYSGKGGFRFVW